MVAGIAASILLFVAGWWIWFNGSSPLPTGDVQVSVKDPATDPLVVELIQRNLKLARGNTPSEGVKAMADVADELQKRSRAGVEDMRVLARLYDRVVRERIIPGAKALPNSERILVLKPIAERLSDVESESSRLAEQANLPPNSVESFRLIASAAREGKEQLRHLISEPKS